VAESLTQVEIPLLSIVTVVRNDRDRLAATVASCVIQTAPEASWEHVIVDGASSDGTAGDALQYRAARSNVTVLSETDIGLYDAMNKGSRLASGRYLLFLNAGDTFAAADSIEYINRALLGFNGAWAIMQVNHLGARPRPEVINRLPFKTMNFWIGNYGCCHQGALFRRDLLLAFGGYALDQGLTADLHLMMRFSIASRPKEIELLATVYEGGGLSAELGGQIPFRMAEARRDLLALTGLGSRANRAFAYLQTIRRFGPVVGQREWRAAKRAAGEQ